MRLLVLSPDFASHWTPLSVVANAARTAGADVIVATGRVMRPAVEAAGFPWRHLRLGRDANAGVARRRVGDESDAIGRFIEATRLGAVATLSLQAEERMHDLLFEPDRVIGDVAALVEELDPDRLVVDHVSFNSTLAAVASGRPFTTVVPGHPSQLPVGDERYGLPPVWPHAVTPLPEDVDELRRRCDRVAERFTQRWNEALAAADPSAGAVDDAFRVTGDRVLLHWPAALHDPRRTALLPADARFSGPLVRDEAPVDPPDGHHRPLVHVALGTFLSHRGDVLRCLADGLRRVDVRVSLATGATPVDRIGPIPTGWWVAEHLPQVGLLHHAALAVSHGGNNSVQEAVAAGVRQVVLPFSTDQFAVAADLERDGAATVFDPNRLTPEVVAETVEHALQQPAWEAVSTDHASVVSALGL